MMATSASLVELWTAIQAINNAHQTAAAADVEAISGALHQLVLLVESPFPELLRPDYVRDACSVLHNDKTKPLLAKLQFLTTREVRENELLCALRILAKEDDDGKELAALSLPEIRRACRHIRVDMVESTMAFFVNRKVANQPFASKVMFLMREQQVERNEIEEALDRLDDDAAAEAERKKKEEEEETRRPSAPAAAAPPVSTVAMDMSAAFTSAPPPVAVVAAAAAPVAPTAAPSTTATPTAAPATTTTTPSSSSRLQQAVTFLRSVPNAQQGQQFLVRQGYSQAEAEEAVAVKRVCDFVMARPGGSQPQPPVDAKVRFLLSKGVVTQHQVDLALKLLGKSQNAKVQRAIDFLANAQAQPLADKLDFLRKQGVTEAELAEALALYKKPPTTATTTGLTPNPTNATTATPPAPPPTQEVFAPSLLDMAQTLLLKLSPALLATHVRLAQDRAGLLAVLLFHDRDVALRLVRNRALPAPNRGWMAELRAFMSSWAPTLDQLVVSSAGQPAEKEAFPWLQRVARLASSSNTDVLDALLALRPSREEDGVSLLANAELDFLLARALHWGLACQLSVGRLVLNDSISSSTLCQAAVLRGFIDYGSGLASKKIQSELRALLNQPATTRGVALVYAGEHWIDLAAAEGSSWRHVCDLVFDCSIPACFSEQRAQLVTQTTAFKLTASIVGLLTSTNTASINKEQLSARVLERGERLFAQVRGNEFVCHDVAKRLVLAANESEDGGSGGDDQLAAVAELARLYRTVYLVLVVLVERCVDLNNAVPQWNLVSHFAFARVHSDEAVRLVELLAMVVQGKEEADMRAFASLVTDSYLTASSTNSTSMSDDYVLGAKIDYLMQTGGGGVDGKPLFLRWEVDWECEAFAQWLLFGCQHGFSLLARDCNVYLTDAIRDACSSSTGSQEDGGGDKASSSLRLRIIPRYFERLAGAAAAQVKTDKDVDAAAVVGFSVGSVFTSLGSTAHAAAPSLACLAFFELVKLASVHNAPVYELCFMALKAVALPSLSLCLDAVDEWLRTTSFARMKAGGDLFVVNEALYGVISRIEDAPRRGLLMVWFLSHVNDWRVAVTPAAAPASLKELEEESTPVFVAKL